MHNRRGQAWAQKMRIKYGDVTHIMCAYRLNNPRDLYNQIVQMTENMVQAGLC